MISIKSHAFLFILLSLSHNTFIKIEEDEEKHNKNRELPLGTISLALGGFLSAFLLRKYLKGQSPIHWGDDKVWEKRFLEIAKNQNLTLEFMNLIIDSYALELSNSCLRFYSLKFQSLNKIIEDKQDLSEDDKEILSLKWSQTLAKIGYCENLFKFVVSHGFLTKYMMDANYAMFYFKLSYMDQKIGEEASLVEFFTEMTNEIQKEENYKKIDQSHKNYFYITVNYLLNTELNLKNGKNNAI